MVAYINIWRNFPRWLIQFLLLLGATGPPFSNAIGQEENKIGELWQDNKIGYITGLQQDKLFTRADFYNYARIRDDDFSEYLKETWHDYSILNGIEEAPGKFQTKHPEFDISSLDITSPVNLPFSGVEGSDVMETGDTQPVPRIRRPENEQYTSKIASFHFYGQAITLRYDKLIMLSVTGFVSEDSVSGFWESFSRSNSNHLVDQLMDYRDLLGLNDWGYFQLVKATSACLFPGSRWREDQLTWALMIRSGFDVRLAFNQNSTSVLFPSHNSIYNKQYILIGQERFYLDREMNSQLLVTCRNPFPDTHGTINLRFNKSLNFKGKLSVQRFSVLWNEKKYEFTLRYNPNLIRFYNDYPSADSFIYFECPVSSTLKEDLIRQLCTPLSQFNKAEAVSWLQKFVQNEFDYNPGNKANNSNPGGFAEQMIATRSGDDRSKSVLFASMINTLLQLPVVGVQFPGYCSTAICYKEPLDGDSYYWRREKYIITDPSFINAPIGLTIPELKGLTPFLIDASFKGSCIRKSEQLWKQVYNVGARRGGANQDVIFDDQGRSVITGYFGGAESNHPFVASFTEGNVLKWIRKFEGEGNAAAYAIARVNEDEIYIAGSFRGKMEMDGKSIQSLNKKGDLFIAQFNQYGELIWMKNVAIDSAVQSAFFAYLVKFDRTGENISIRMFNEDQRNISTGFGGISETGLYLTGSGYYNFANYYSPSRTTFDILTEISKNDNTATGKQCHPKVAGIVTVMKWLRKPGNAITGEQIEEFIIRNNSLLPVNRPALFKMLGRIALLKNENGIVLLKTIDYKSLYFFNLKLENEARFTISNFDNGDFDFRVVTGIYHMINPVMLPLNSLTIDCSSGNLVLDYDSGHTLGKVSPDP